MIYRIYGQKDTTIYELNTRKSQNTGLDEVLEVSKLYDEATQSTFVGNSRVLTKFDITAISKSIVDGDIPSSPNFQLNLTSIGEEEVLSEYKLEAYPVSQSWSEGKGQFYDTPISSRWV